MLVIHDAADDDRIRHAQSVAHSNNHPFDKAYADYMAAVHFALVEQFEASRSFAQNSVALSDKFGFPQFAGIARIPLGRALAGLGDHQQGLALIADGLDRMDATSVRVARTMYLTWQADLCLQAGLVDQAMRSADDALFFNPSEAFYRPETLRVRANVLHVIGHTEAAAAAPVTSRHPSRTPKSSTGKTSGRPSVDISSISTVHRPTPLIADSRVISASSDSPAAAAALGTVPSSVLAQMSRIAATLLPENPHPRSASSGTPASTSGAGNLAPHSSPNRRKIARAALPCSC